MIVVLKQHQQKHLRDSKNKTISHHRCPKLMWLLPFFSENLTFSPQLPPVSVQPRNWKRVRSYAEYTV